MPETVTITLSEQSYLRMIALQKLIRCSPNVAIEHALEIAEIEYGGNLEAFAKKFSQGKLR